ncbi:cysteine-rich CWC family protein [Shewanella sp. UCD-KL12]|uniref:cysteine-rich CWC family protein n=1 Tax=Shewanella sp. UCD-KL12 TaxID=1917163 RepID=UPI0009F8CBA0|nr:cysteine-rich CWC family protein [Shewanella sp. UCD-KL12]
MSKQKGNQTLCPLCQSSNECAVNSGGDINACWCSKVSFPSKEIVAKSLLSKNTCICRACIEKLKQEEQLGIKRVD